MFSTQQYNISKTIKLVGDNLNDDVKNVFLFYRSFIVGFDGFFENENVGLSNELEEISEIFLDITYPSQYPFYKINESYSLTVADRKIKIKCESLSGMIYAFETLLQVLEGTEGHRYISELFIFDEPDYPWRGFKLDLSSTFHNMDELFYFLDLMALSRLNVLHLQIMGANFGICYGGQEKQCFDDDSVRKIVDYAALRGVRVLPEFTGAMDSKAFMQLSDDWVVNCSASELDFEGYTLSPAHKDLNKGISSYIDAITGYDLFHDNFALVNARMESEVFTCFNNSKVIKDWLGTHDLDYAYSTLVGAFVTHLSSLKNVVFNSQMLSYISNKEYMVVMPEKIPVMVNQAASVMGVLNVDDPIQNIFDLDLRAGVPELKHSSVIGGVAQLPYKDEDLAIAGYSLFLRVAPKIIALGGRLWQTETTDIGSFVGSLNELVCKLATERNWGISTLGPNYCPAINDPKDAPVLLLTNPSHGQCMGDDVTITGTNFISIPSQIPPLLPRVEFVMPNGERKECRDTKWVNGFTLNCTSPVSDRLGMAEIEVIVEGRTRMLPSHYLNFEYRAYDTPAVTDVFPAQFTLARGTRKRITVVSDFYRNYPTYIEVYNNQQSVNCTNLEGVTKQTIKCYVEGLEVGDYNVQMVFGNNHTTPFPIKIVPFPTPVVTYTCPQHFNLNIQNIFSLDLYGRYLCAGVSTAAIPQVFIDDKECKNTTIAGSVVPANGDCHFLSCSVNFASLPLGAHNISLHYPDRSVQVYRMMSRTVETDFRVPWQYMFLLAIILASSLSVCILCCQKSKNPAWMKYRAPKHTQYTRL
ncbi:hypothetical protein PCE1_003866 [Barthelona sp. PCE]